MVKTATNQNGDKPERRQVKTAKICIVTTATN